MRVLIVDDEMGMRLFLRTLFETGGHEAVVARNGQEGLARAREIRPHLVVLDVMMPGGGGLVMYRALRNDADLAATPVIMLSGVKGSTFAHALELYDAAAGTLPPPEAYVEKPPRPDEILALAERLTGCTASCG
ncbi:response regulator [Nitratidesulfovibrio vulgaris]|uniref:Response regulator n=2 Tax=Nitratidesulfovibrio vulgaris TaxID=881 RepID=Q72FF4_NITV2|nr:response regulator [Nitratidesulfovibrio vulgaris]GEB80195.1 response regulator [Desulfovibrio desulfuricans]HBW16831.1 response regulator [Desulfovibrio sp.]AAS94743.1 response regulator [Nitratidesulfovibrio vulgaris str. Hildenborough]ABM29729.1 response regulator receiver protein [Nitratidesulfovibrio vulgaris DP4]ADP85403.1 response regulator receiver protein [Nitratidesulfovibrio vulgaris RCH1]